MRHHPLVLQRLAVVAPADCAISSITTYELYTGIEKCADPTKELAKVDLLLAMVSELVFDGGAREAGRIRPARIPGLHDRRLQMSSWPVRPDPLV